MWAFGNLFANKLSAFHAVAAATFGHKPTQQQRKLANRCVVFAAAAAAPCQCQFTQEGGATTTQKPCNRVTAAPNPATFSAGCI